MGPDRNTGPKSAVTQIRTHSHLTLSQPEKNIVKVGTRNSTWNREVIERLQENNCYTVKFRLENSQAPLIAILLTFSFRMELTTSPYISERMCILAGKPYFSPDLGFSVQNVFWNSTTIKHQVAKAIKQKCFV